MHALVLVRVESERTCEYLQRRFGACAFAIAYAVWLALAGVRSCLSVQANDVSCDVAPYLCSAMELRT